LRAMAKKFAVDLYFDVISPYSFILFESLLAYRSKWPMAITLKPMAISHVMKAAGNKPPALAVPAKGPYMFKDVMRLARYYNIPFKFRDDFMTIITTKSSINADRLICAVQLAEPEKAEAVARALFRRFWVERNDIFEKEDFIEVLSACGVSSPSSLLSAISSEAVKGAMKQNTDEAVESGCFGAPWTVLTLENGKKEHFFGSDRLHIIGHMMGQKFDGPLSSSL
ncbi:hypothetical protein PENTCL1PPCAC_4823, partial [Pristionchus entomophagus]